MGSDEDHITGEGPAAPDAAPEAAGVAGKQPRGSWFPCPYCGQAHEIGAAGCSVCGGLFEPLSRQASQNQMGPWYLRDEASPFMPGRSYETLQKMVARGKITGDTVLRGPTGRQFWMTAGETPGVANLLGWCHSCKHRVAPDAYSCANCGAVFPVPTDRQALGLGEVRLLPGQGPPTLIARASVRAEQADDPPTAFAAIARAAVTKTASGRPTSPSPLPPAAGPAPGPGGADPAPGPAPDTGSELRAALRVAHGRIVMLRGVLAVLIVVNVLLLTVLAWRVFVAGGASEPAPPDVSGSTP